MKTSTTDFIYDTVNKRIIEQLEKGTVPWRKPWIAEDFPVNLITKKEYGGYNWWILLISQVANKYNSNVWASFKQISESKGKVKKGQKATMVIFWKILQYESKTLKDKKGNPKIEKIPLLRYYNVFNLDQTEGIDYKKEKPRTIEKNLTAEAIIKKYTKEVSISFGGNRAFYSPTQDSITLPTRKSFTDDNEFYATNFHEMTHSTGHKKRLNRFGEGNYNHTFGSADYSKEELVAEMGSAYLCAKTKILPAVLNNSGAYIKSWLKALKNDKTLLVSAGGKAQRAVNYIVNGKELVK